MSTPTSEQSAAIGQALLALKRSVDVFDARISKLSIRKDNSGLRSKLDTLRVDIQDQLARLDGRISALQRTTLSPSSKLAATRITGDYADLERRFREAEQSYERRCAQDDQANAFAAADDDDYEQRNAREQMPLVAGSRPSGGALLAQASLTVAAPQVDELEVQYNDALIAERDEDIRHLERETHLVNDLFRKVGSLISDQGQLVDHIETNVQRAQVQVENAGHQLRSANQRSRSWRDCKCWLLLVLAVFAGILTLILVLF
ncbi:t-SNARE [Blastocladiella britannica]|nr:t-SNARE [Blastocladiella britannica]